MRPGSEPDRGERGRTSDGAVRRTRAVPRARAPRTRVRHCRRHRGPGPWGQRLTQDLDIAISGSSDNLARLAATLSDLDARVLGPAGERSGMVPTAQLLGSSDLWHLITDHGALDVLMLPAHLGPFADMRARALEVRLGELTIPIAHATIWWR